MTYNEFSCKTQKELVCGENFLRLTIDRKGFEVVDDIKECDAIIGVITYSGDIDETLLNELQSIYNDYNSVIEKMIC